MSEIAFNVFYMLGTHLALFVVALLVKPRHNRKVHLLSVFIPLAPALVMNWLKPFNSDVLFLYTLVALVVAIASTKNVFVKAVKVSIDPASANPQSP